MYSREEGKGIKIVSLLGYPELTLNSCQAKVLGTPKTRVNLTPLPCSRGPRGPRVNREKLFYEEFAEQVIEMLKSRRTPWPRRPELARSVKTSDNVFNLAPRNPVSGTTYRGVNSLRLALTAQKNGWKDPRWMTFNQAKAQGYRIKKGS